MSTAFELPAGEDAVIRGNIFTARQPAQGIIILAHGYKGFKDWGMFPYTASQLSENYHVLTFNFSHNGVGEDLEQFSELEKFAVNTYSRELADLATLLDYVSTQPELHGLPVFLLGHSRGAGVSLVYALDHPEQIAGVLSWNGVTNLDLFTPEQKEEMRTHGRSHVTNGRTGQQMPLDVSILEDLDAHKERYAIIDRLVWLLPLCVWHLFREQRTAHGCVTARPHWFRLARISRGTRFPAEIILLILCIHSRNRRRSLSRRSPKHFARSQIG